MLYALESIFLVGSFLEDDLINEINKLGNFHPVLKCQLPKEVKVIKFSEFINEKIKEIDLLVVGGGAAGATAAFHLAKSGKNVCLLEKSNTIKQSKKEREHLS